MGRLFWLALVAACLVAPSGAAAQTAAARLRSPFSVSFDQLWLRELPWSSDATALLETVEAAAVSDRFSQGGLSAGESARLGIHSASWSELQHRLGGFDVTDPERGGTPLVLVPRVALDGLRLQTAALGAEIGAPGALLSLDPLRPGAKWSRRLALLAAPPGLQSDVKAGSAPAIARQRDAYELAAVANGPLIRDRLGATFALEWERADRSERGAAAELRGDRKSALGQLVWTPSQRDEAQLHLAGHDLRRPFAGRARFADPKVGEGDRAFLAGGSWLRRSSAGARLLAKLSFAARKNEPAPEGGRAKALERLAAGPIGDSVVDENGLRVFRGEASYSPRARTTGRFQHEPSLTAQAEWSRLTTTPSPALVVAELVDGRPARAWSFSEAGAAWRSLSRLGFAVGDRISLSERLDAQLGLRIDAQRGSRPGAAGLVLWRDVSPRAALEARPFHGLPVFLHAGFARYPGRLPLNLLAFGDPAARSADVLRWTDANRDGVFQPSERGAIVMRAGPGGSFVSMDPDLAAPRTTEYTAGLGFERGALRFTFSGVHRRTRGFAETVNVGAPASSYRVSRIADPAVDLVGTGDDQLLPLYERLPSTFGQDRFVLTNPEGHDVTQEGVEFALELSPGERLRLRLGGTASKTTGAGANRGFLVGENDPGLPGELFDNPNADSFKSGRMFFDRAYTLKLAGVYRIGGWGAGFAARYQDGQPFARVVIAEGLNQGPEIVPAVQRGDHRFTYILTADARIARTFRVGRALVTASLEAFSLFRQRREVEEYVVSGPGFRSVSAAQPPRSVRLGLSLSY